jgi:protein tyrosine/serine phosphatase
LLARRTVWIACASLAWVGATRAEAPEVRPKPARARAERLENLPGLKNVGRIAPGILRGDEPSREGLQTLKAMGVKTVINLRHYHGGDEEKACRDLGLDYVRLALESSDAPRDEDVRRFLAIVTDPARQPVYFHCWRGKDRTGTLAAVYRIAVEGWPLDEALAEMDEFGFFKGYQDLRGYVKRIAAQPSLVWPLPTSPTPTP